MPEIPAPSEAGEAPSRTSTRERSQGAQLWPLAGRILVASGKGSLATLRVAGTLAESLRPFAWPAMVLFVFLYYESPLTDLLDRVNRVETPVGTIAFDRSGVRQTGEDLTRLAAVLAEPAAGEAAPVALAAAPAPAAPETSSAAADGEPAAAGAPSEIEIEPAPPPPPSPFAVQQPMLAAPLAQFPIQASSIGPVPATPDFIVSYRPAASAARSEPRQAVRRMARDLRALDAFLNNATVAPLLSGFPGYYDLLTTISFLEFQVEALRLTGFGAKSPVDPAALADDVSDMAGAVDELFATVRLFLDRGPGMVRQGGPPALQTITVPAGVRG